MTDFRLAKRHPSIPSATGSIEHAGPVSDFANLSPSRRRRALLARLTGPGGYYNLGNAIGLAAGPTQQVAAAPRDKGAEVTAFGTIHDYLIGSPPATALTVAMVIFFLSSELYFRGWSREGWSDLRLIRLGDLFSGLGALVLLVALAIYGSTWLAVTSTILLAAGKVGSAMRPGAQWRLRLRAGRTVDPLRLMVILSRLIAMVAVVSTMVGLAASSSFTVSQAAPQIVLLLCYGLWLRADVLLNSLTDP
ncbi:hypothetical protein OCH239_18595 [Roseivivax halodurans JCM 10272]|uniref:Uncharacterized protein n=1 Tax=Roseivivax halodurans JCM 10272 TaxID=1449350 RepID=X7E861_9RHOB|nr:hypothetical protein [Roseivivax halodurans]ETX12025.1 hypothetical protein OCH239_18595 [Roseivivax halodurans JCM 10272]